MFSVSALCVKSIRKFIASFSPRTYTVWALKTHRKKHRVRYNINLSSCQRMAMPASIFLSNVQCVCIVCTKYQNNYSKYESQSMNCLSTQDPQEETLSKKQCEFVILSKNGYAGIKFFKQCSVCLHCVYKVSK